MPRYIDTAGQTKNAGLYTAPAVPASTATATNSSGSAVLVMVQGGTVTVVAVNGVTVGTTQGLFLVPAGETIAITYSVAPTWRWYQLPG
jgi:hypothetical protein